MPKKSIKKIGFYRYEINICELRMSGLGCIKIGCLVAYVANSCVVQQLATGCNLVTATAAATDFF
jgi:hypothetical protein